MNLKFNQQEPQLQLPVQEEKKVEKKVDIALQIAQQ
jgi:hypothetical protein